jgi:hypothetical protein
MSQPIHKLELPSVGIFPTLYLLARFYRSSYTCTSIVRDDADDDDGHTASAFHLFIFVSSLLVDLIISI